MTLGETVRTAREGKALTQLALAGQVGVTPGFITKLEKNEALPGDNLLAVLAGVLGLEAGVLLKLAEEARQERAGQRQRTRGLAIRQAVGVSREKEPAKVGAEVEPGEGAQQLWRELQADPELRAAVHHLRAALADPDLKGAVLKTLETFARQARAGKLPHP